jgi:archaellum biogenesis ATPase FlaH
MIISGPAKSGKVTFLYYLLSNLYKEKALLFTPQDEFLFNKKTDTFAKQFHQFSNIREMLDIYYLRSDFNALKQKYGYEFLLEEFRKLFALQDEKVVVLHRFGEFFGFEDRYEINTFYKSLIRMAQEFDKKIIFLVNNSNENFEHIYTVAEELSDMAITLSKNEKNERVVNILDLMHYAEYPKLLFKINEGNFLLEFESELQDDSQKRIQNILIAELDKAHDDMREIFSYIFNRDHFKIKYADSFQKILKEIFIKPDVILLLMKRTQDNIETIRVIKAQLPNTHIIAILDQNFVRSEDVYEFFQYGCDDVFANNLSFDNLILAMQKATGTDFYTKEYQTLPMHKNVMKDISELKALAYECIEKSLFFTLFVLESKDEFPKVTTTSRRSDYIVHAGNKLYYMVVNTMPKDVYIIADKFTQSNPDLHFSCIWEPINSVDLEGCFR